jgi:hypothetical protein
MTSTAFSKQLKLGAPNALKAQRMLKAKYWVGTHDEVKIGSGLIAPFLRRKAYSILDAPRKERREEGSSADMQTSTASEPNVYRSQQWEEFTSSIEHAANDKEAGVVRATATPYPPKGFFSAGGQNLKAL